MEQEQKKRKYLDKLKKISSKGNNQDTGILDIQNGNSYCFNESSQKYIEPTFESNDLLAKVERYIKANPTSHITKNRLTINRGFQSNLQNKNNIDPVHKSCDLQNAENVISLIKPRQKVLKYKPDTKIKFGPPNATSTIKHQKTQCVSISSKHIIKPTNIGKSKSCSMNENKDGEFSPSSGSSYSAKLTLPKMNINNNEDFSSTISSNNKFNKNQCINIDEKTKLNLKYCLYLEFIHSSCNEIKHINKEIHVNNEYSVNLKKQLHQIKLKHQNEQCLNNTNLMSSTISPLHDKSINYFNTTQSRCISNYSDFIFKPVLNLSISPDIRFTQSSQDSFIYSTQETLFTNIDDSMNIDQNKCELNENNFSSPEMCSSGNNNNPNQRGITRHQSIFTHFASPDLSTKKFFQKLNNIQESSSVCSEDSSFEYFRKSMF